MICPFCQHENIAGEDTCAECGQSLIGMDEAADDLGDSISSHAIELLNPREPVFIAPGDPLKDAVRLMVENHIGCLLVVHDDVLIGIITERDVLNKGADDDAHLEQPVVEFMTAAPVTIRRQDSIAYALHAMDLGGYRHMPIVDETGRPTAIISVRDILRFLCVRFADSRAAS
ncbi:MAG: CBS domain-containing protein [Planctomycetaceae bacterium]